jgi:hypothetical protein
VNFYREKTWVIHHFHSQLKAAETALRQKLWNFFIFWKLILLSLFTSNLNRNLQFWLLAADFYFLCLAFCFELQINLRCEYTYIYMQHYLKIYANLTFFGLHIHIYFWWTQCFITVQNLIRFRQCFDQENIYK